MTTIMLGRPERNDGRWVVFGSYEGQDDRFTFGIRTFDATDGGLAEACARRMMEKFEADHFVRL